jgi:hypothetical protein
MSVERGYLRTETESKVTAAQDQASQTKYHSKELLQRVTDCKCRLCQQFDETVDHVSSACPILAKEQCIKQPESVGV